MNKEELLLEMRIFSLLKKKKRLIELLEVVLCLLHVITHHNPKGARA